ncbi:TPA: hypothetical protein HA265_08580 [Candidatus Woesearchaeota archaeon]|nr:hypothetical protein [Candidatus Woesearchaeota archaeon]
MKITICGSIAFYDEMLQTKKELEALGHQAKLPPSEIQDDDGNIIPVMKYYEMRKKESSDTSWIWDEKEKAMRAHFDKVEWSDAVLLLNCDKKGIKGYVGANTLLEAGLAMHLKKPIFLLNQIPEMDYKEEILGMKPIVINGDLRKIR